MSFQSACLREPTAGAAYDYASQIPLAPPARPGRCSSGGRTSGATCPGLRQEPAPSEGLWPDGLSGVDTVDTHSRGRSDCRPAFSLRSLMFSGLSSLSSTGCPTSEGVFCLSGPRGSSFSTKRRLRLSGPFHSFHGPRRASPLSVSLYEAGLVGRTATSKAHRKVFYVLSTK